MSTAPSAGPKPPPTATGVQSIQEPPSIGSSLRGKGGTSPTLDRNSAREQTTDPASPPAHHAATRPGLQGGSRSEAQLPSDAAEEADSTSAPTAGPAPGVGVARKQALAPLSHPRLSALSQAPGTLAPLPKLAGRLAAEQPGSHRDSASRTPADTSAASLKQPPPPPGRASRVTHVLAGAPKVPQHSQLPHQPDLPAQQQQARKQQERHPAHSGYLDEMATEAAVEAAVERLRRSAGFVAEHKKDKNFTLMHYAAMLGHRTLEEAKRPKGEDTAREHLHYARIVRCLSKGQPKAVHVVDQYGCTPLHLAAACGNVGMVNALMDSYDNNKAYGLYGEEANRSRGNKRAGEGPPRADVEVSRQGELSQPNLKAYLNHKDKQICFTALHGAMNSGHLDVATLLLLRGADPEALDVTRRTPFQVAPSKQLLQDLLGHVVDRWEEFTNWSLIVQLMSAVPQWEREHIAAKEATATEATSAMDAAVAAKKAAAASAAAATAVLASAVETAAAAKEAAAASKGDAAKKAAAREAAAAAAAASAAAKQAEAKEADAATNEARAKQAATAAKQVAAAAKETAAAEAAADSEEAELKQAGDGLQGVMRRFFTLQLCTEPAELGYVTIVKCFVTAVERHDKHLTKVMLLLIMDKYRVVLLSRAWGDALEPLITLFPSLFQLLISGLQNMPDSDVAGFARTLSFQQSSTAAGEAARQWSLPTRMRSKGAAPMIDTSLSDSVSDQAKLQMYRYLLLELGKVEYRVVKIFLEEASEDLLNDMATYPIYAEFVGLLAVKQPPQGAQQRSGEALRIWRKNFAADLRAIMPKLECEEPQTSAASRVWGKIVVGIGAKVAPEGAEPEPYVAGAAKRLDPETLNVGPMLNAAVKGRMAHNVHAVVVSIARWAEAKPEKMAVFITGVSNGLLRELARRFPSSCAKLLNLMTRDVAMRLETVQVPATLLLAGRPYRVECSNIHNHFTWQYRELRRLPKEQGYNVTVIDALVDYGIPFECVLKAAVEQRTQAQQLATLIEKGFSGSELRQLISNGVPLDKIIEHIYECEKPLPKGTFEDAKAMEDAAKSIAKAIEDAKAMGDAKAVAKAEGDAKANDKAMNDAKKMRIKLHDNPMAELLRDMLRQGLNPTMLTLILEEGNGTEAGPRARGLGRAYPKALFDPQYTHHFVQLFLIYWRQGSTGVDRNKPQPPWSREFLDTAFQASDPLYTRLQNVYANKLLDTPAYTRRYRRGETGETDHGREDREARRHWLLLHAFVHGYFLLHRFPVALLMCALLYLKRKLTKWSLRWQLWEEESSADRHRLVDARALVIPWRCISNLDSRPDADGDDPAATEGASAPVAKLTRADTVGSTMTLAPSAAGQAVRSDQQGMLAALVQSDVPVRWFGFTAVKAVVAVHWQAYGQMLMFMSALAHLMFMAFFGCFLLVLRNAGEEEGGDMTKVRWRREVLALMLVLVVLSIGGLSEEVAQVWELSLRTWRSHLGNLVDIASFALYFAIAGMVCSACTYDFVLAVCAVETLVLFIRLVFFASMTDSMGSLMRMVIEIIKDMRYFFLLLAMIFGGFAIAFAVLQGVSLSYESIAFKLFSVILGDWSWEYLSDMLHVEGSWYVPRLSVILMSLYGILMLIVLVNLLIAIMNDTYDRIKETEEIEVLRNRARLIVELGSLLSNFMRIKLQGELLGDYLHVLLPADKVGEYMSSTMTVEGDWKGRMRAFSEALRRDMDPKLQAIRETLNDEFKVLRDELVALRKRVDQEGPSPTTTSPVDRLNR